MRRVNIDSEHTQYRDLMLVHGEYPGAKETPIPCSDGAGEIVSVGERVKKWKVGDRVAANFSPAHLYGDITPVIQSLSLGAPTDGTLMEYRIFPAEVCRPRTMC